MAKCTKCKKREAIGRPASQSGLCLQCGQILIEEHREDRIRRSAALPQFVRDANERND